MLGGEGRITRTAEKVRKKWGEKVPKKKKIQKKRKISFRWGFSVGKRKQTAGGRKTRKKPLSNDPRD